MKVKRILALLIVWVLAFGLAACNSTSTLETKTTQENTATEKSTIADTAKTDQKESSGSNETNYSIAVSVNALDDFMSEWYKYFETYAKSLGCIVNMTNADGDMDKQISDIESLIQMKPDVILINAVDTEGIIPAFEACDAAGIPTIDHTLSVNYDNTLHLVFDQIAQAQLQADWCEEWLSKNEGETIRAGYLWGAQGNINAKYRFDGWNDQLTEDVGDSYELLAEGAANWSATEAMNYCEDWMQAYQDMNFIVAANDEMAIAASNVVDAAGKAGEVMILGIDGSEEGQQYVRDGFIAATVYVPRQLMAENGVDYCIRIAGGEDLTGQEFDICDGQYLLLTQDTIDEQLGTN